jgi:nitroreductase
MTEPWEVIFIGPETRKQLNHKTDFGTAPVVFAVLSHKGSSEVMREENLAAVSCMIQNYLLLAWSHGVGTFWSSLGVSSSVKKTLEVSKEYDVVGIFGTGYPEEIPAEKERTPIMSKVKHMK